MAPECEQALICAVCLSEDHARHPVKALKAFLAQEGQSFCAIYEANFHQDHLHEQVDRGLREAVREEQASVESLGASFRNLEQLMHVFYGKLSKQASTKITTSFLKDCLAGLKTATSREAADQALSYLLAACVTIENKDKKLSA
jgi:hypothetical protein